MFTILKKFGPYAAMHFLTTVPENHQCGNEHGHNYEIELELSSPTLDEKGFVVDYGELKKFDEYATGRMDHKNINKQFNFPTTAENLAKHFYDWIAGTTSWPIAAVRVSESPGKTMSEYRRPEKANVAELYITIETEIVASSTRKIPWKEMRDLFRREKV